MREHLAFGLQVRSWSANAIRERVREPAGWLGLESILGRCPAGLSGGEAQRVALGRALAFRPRVLCLDEPLSALDQETRAEVKQLLQIVRERSGVTILHVTHSQGDARDLADCVFVLRDGRCVPDGILGSLVS